MKLRSQLPATPNNPSGSRILSKATIWTARERGREREGEREGGREREGEREGERERKRERRGERERDR